MGFKVTRSSSAVVCLLESSFSSGYPHGRLLYGRWWYTCLSEGDICCHPEKTQMPDKGFFWHGDATTEQIWYTTALLVSYLILVADSTSVIVCALGEQTHVSELPDDGGGSGSTVLRTMLHPDVCHSILNLSTQLGDGVKPNLLLSCVLEVLREGER